jgi:hypothetical protein
MTTTGEIGTALAICVTDPTHRRTIFIKQNVDGEKWAVFKRGRTPSGCAMAGAALKSYSWQAERLHQYGLTEHTFFHAAFREWVKSHPKTLDTLID